MWRVLHNQYCVWHWWHMHICLSALHGWRWIWVWFSIERGTEIWINVRLWLHCVYSWCICGQGALCIIIVEKSNGDKSSCMKLCDVGRRCRFRIHVWVDLMKDPTDISTEIDVVTFFLLYWGVFIEIQSPVLLVSTIWFFLGWDIDIKIGVLIFFVDMVQVDALTLFEYFLHKYLVFILQWSAPSSHS